MCNAAVGKPSVAAASLTGPCDSRIIFRDGSTVHAHQVRQRCSGRELQTERFRREFSGGSLMRIFNLRITEE